MVVSIRSSLVKKHLNISLPTKMLKIRPFAYFSQKWMHVEKALMKPW